jgi:hypothetical protein
LRLLLLLRLSRLILRPHLLLLLLLSLEVLSLNLQRLSRTHCPLVQQLGLLHQRARTRPGGRSRYAPDRRP